MLHLLLIDDDPGDARLVSHQLSRARRHQEFSLTTAQSLVEAAGIVADRPVDVVLLDLGLPDSSGLETVDRACKLFGRLPIVVLTGLDSEEAGLESLRRGAGDYLVKGKFTDDLLVRTIRYAVERKQLELQLLHMARHDSLTGALNRRAFDDVLEHAISRARRGRCATLMVFDVDHFKQVNDTFGHSTGDWLLVRLVQTVRDQLRDTDVLCRTGGDEFAVLLEDADADGAHAVAERIRANAADLLRFDQVQSGLSIGIARIDGSLDVESLLRRADQCMYNAKTAGRDRVCVA